MTLKFYECINWGPHKHVPITFPVGAKTIALCGENDEGKSWIVRGIGFCLSIGRNEYGDQSAILAGETEARHKLVIEHDGIDHVIEKIVKGKGSEEEGTKTFIDGTPTDRAGYEAFYEKLGLPHPSVWLPIVVAMQNETDYHLRRKKSEREESLRGACQLTRIDSWKESLQAKTNEVDRTLLAEESNLKGSLAGTKRELEGLLEEQKGLEAGITAARQPNGPAGVGLEAAIICVQNWEEATGALKRTTLETENKNNEWQLCVTARERLEKELAGLPGESPEEEAKKERTQEDLTKELQAREKKLASAKLSAAVKKGSATRKALEELPKTASTVDIKAATKTLQDAASESAVAAQKAAEHKKLCEEAGEPALAQGSAGIKAALETKPVLLEKIRTHGNAMRASLKSAQELWGSEQDARLILKEATTSAAANAPFGTGPVGDAEGKNLLERLLEHWEEAPHESCPVCSQALATLPSFQNGKTRRAVLASLKNEILPTGEIAKARQKAERAANAAQDAIREEEVLKSLTEGKDWQESAEALAAEITRLRHEGNLVTQADQAKRSGEEKAQEAKRLLESLKELCPKTGAAEEAAANLENIRDQETRRAVLTAQLAAEEREIEALSDSFERVSDAGTPSEEEPLQSKETDALKEELATTSASLREIKRARATRAEKEKDRMAARSKESTSKKALDLLKTEKEGLEKKTSEGCGMPSIAETTGNEATAAAWRKLEKTATELEARLRPLPARIAAKELETKATEAALAECARKTLKAATARRLVNFLDYKNAPRQLLIGITEKLFTTTNRIGEILQANISLKVGKNLEFLTLQHRNGHLIEQKTERLGFGKGAILGICFRLACQKRLTPGIGFLILDEPTANVDTKRKSALKAFLQNLGEETESTTKQIILIEHDLDVIELAQAKIKIGGSQTPEAK